MRCGRRDCEGLETDFSEVDQLAYRCIDGCALCCLCQPELLPSEEEWFRGQPDLADAVTDEHISSDVRGAAIRLRGAHGACYFLEDRRCRVYDVRPHFCSMFPINIFLGWRVQLNANLSCRGIGLPGEPLGALARHALADYSREKLSAELDTAKKVFADFVRNTRTAAVAQSFSSVRGAAAALSEELVDPIGLSRILTYAEHGSTRQNATVAEVARRVRTCEAEAELQERALMDGTELFDLPHLSLLPIYVDPELRWKVFRLVGGEIVGYVLSEDGSTQEFSRTDPSDVDLLPMTIEGRSAATKYLGTVNARDCFMGHAAYLCDIEGYGYNLAQVYLGAIANNSLDLWWRSSFLAHIEGKERLRAYEVREGIVFFDMDLLDLPTIGAFV